MSLLSPPSPPPPSVAVLEGFLWEAFPATCPAPSSESCSTEGQTIAGGEKLQESLRGREEGQGLFPGSRFFPPLGLPLLICLMASLSPSHPCLPPVLISPPLLVSLSLSLISPLSLSCFSLLFGLCICLFCSLPLPLSSLFFFCVSLLCLSCYVSILVSLSVPLSLSSLPLSPSPFPICLSPQSKKPSLMVPKVSGPYACPVLCCLSVCFSISWRDQEGGLSHSLVGDLGSASAKHHGEGQTWPVVPAISSAIP